MAAKKKVVLLLDLHDHDAKEKRKALKAVTAYPGIDMVSIDMKARKLTVVGLVDPIELVTKLRKLWHAEIYSVGPAKEEDKDGAYDEDSRTKEEANYQHQQLLQEAAAAAAAQQQVVPAVSYVYPPRDAYPPPSSYPYHQPHQYHVPYGDGGRGGAQALERGRGRARAHAQAQEDPNSCVIC